MTNSLSLSPERGVERATAAWRKGEAAIKSRPRHKLGPAQDWEGEAWVGQTEPEKTHLPEAG